MRIRLIERLCRLPEEHLPRVDRFFQELEKPAPPSGDKVPTAVSPTETNWPHAPPHRLSENGTFFITASTRDKQHFFAGADKLTLLEGELLRLAKLHEVLVEAWAIFSNHYHCIAHATGAKNQIKDLISCLHTSTATKINDLDRMPTRKVWFNFWETALTFEKSYFVRLNYVHHNAVKHGLAAVANQYRWCSAAWFERTATSAQVKTIYSFKYDRVKIDDDYEPIL